MADFDLSGYVTVAERLAKLFAEHPDAHLQPWRPWQLVEVDGRAFVVYEAACYYGPDDHCPGVGIAWEPFPGRTPYTRDSELMNAETSAWGRAIVAKGAADTGAGVATRDEIEARGDRPASGPQRRKLEQLVEERGLPDDLAWPLPDDLGMRAAASWIDTLSKQPRETPPPERRATMRPEGPAFDLPPSRAAVASPPAGPVPEPETTANEPERRPWRRRPFPWDGTPDQVAAWWRVAYAAVPGVAHARFLNAAREIAAENELPVPASVGAIADPELVDRMQHFLDTKAEA